MLLTYYSLAEKPLRDLNPVSIVFKLKLSFSLVSHHSPPPPMFWDLFPYGIPTTAVVSPLSHCFLSPSHHQVLIQVVFCP